MTKPPDWKKIYNLAARQVQDTNKRLYTIFKSSHDRIEAELVKLRLKYIKGGVMQPFKEDRLKGLLQFVNAELLDLKTKSITAVRSGYVKNYERTYYLETLNNEYQINNLGLTVNYSLNVPAIDKEFIIQSFDKRVGGFAFRDRTKQIQRIMQYDLQNAIAQNLIEGKTVKQLAKDIELIGNAFNKGYYNYDRIARTELLKAYSLGQEEATNEAETSGVEFTYQWVSTLDNKVRKAHARADGQKALIIDGKPQFTVGGVKFSSPRVVINPTGSKKEAGQVINCRCRRINIPFGISPTKRVAKTKEGTWKTINADVTASEWVKREYGVNVNET